MYRVTKSARGKGVVITNQNLFFTSPFFKTEDKHHKKKKKKKKKNVEQAIKIPVSFFARIFAQESKKKIVIVGSG